jgi:KDO2-lipid IV(A) lauroyltransferase
MAYKIVYALLYTISLLPFWFLYGIAHFLYFVFYRLLAYRKKVVRENLTLSFPEKTEKEIQTIERKFYRNLCDSIVETIKMMSISKEELSKRFTNNWEVVNSIKDTNAVVFVSHQFNWEWGTLLTNAMIDKQFVGPYLPLTSEVFDKIMNKIRGRFGTVGIPANKMARQIPVYQAQDSLWGFVADQTPADTKRCAWEDFFHRKTAFAKGGELLARRYNLPVVMGEMVKLKRGYYETKLKLTFENPRETKDGEITAAYVRFLEDSIKRQPENWVWSHRRWKHVYQTSD